MVVRSACIQGKREPQANGARQAGSRRSSRLLARTLACVALGSLAVQGCTEPTFDDAGAASGANDAAADDDDEGGQPRDAGGSSTPADAANPTPQPDGALDEQEDAGSGLDASLDAAPPTAEGGAGGDAGGDASADASVPTEVLPAWAEPLIGSYARRAVTFSFDSMLGTRGGNTRNVEYSVLTISKRNAQLELSIQLCDYALTVPGGSDTPVFFKYPSRIPPLKGQLVLKAPNTFESEPMMHPIGFEPLRGGVCGTTGRHDRYAEQTWLSSTCQCLNSLIPTSLNDCRVNDVDDDGMPGLTLSNQVLPGVTAEVSIVLNYALTFVEGQVKPDKRHELRELRTQSQACVNAAVDSCDLGRNELCPGGSTLLLPLTGPATCANINRAEFGMLDPFPTTIDCRAKAP